MQDPEVSPDVFGIETEYSAQIELPGERQIELSGSCHSGDELMGLNKQPKHSVKDAIKIGKIASELSQIGIKTSRQSKLLSNGGRLYLDPSGFEYCTPETTTAEEAVLRSFDGDQIMLKLLNGLTESGVIESFQLNRRIVDHNRTSRGIHLNTSTFLENIPGEEEMGVIATLNTVKGAMFGSGGLLMDEDGDTYFHHSPRLSLTIGVKGHDWAKRPLVRLPFQTDGDLSRVETASGDALNFAWPMRASLVATNALFKMLEMGVPGLPFAKRPVSDAQRVGRLGYETTLEVWIHDDLKSMRPQEVMEEFSATALDLHEERPFLSEEEVQVLGEIINVANLLTSDPDRTASVVESVARKKAFDKLIRDHAKEGRKIDLASKEACRRDYYWDKLNGGMAERLRRHKDVGWHGFTADRSIRAEQKRIFTPPQDTRAKIRGELISSGNGRRVHNWSKIAQLNSSNGTSYYGPLETEL